MRGGFCKYGDLLPIPPVERGWGMDLRPRSPNTWNTQEKNGCLREKRRTADPTDASSSHALPLETESRLSAEDPRSPHRLQAPASRCSGKGRALAGAWG